MSLVGVIPNLKREEVQVFHHVRQTLITGESPITLASPSPVFTEGEIRHYKHMVRVQQIPSGRGWKWNQSRKKKELRIGEDEEQRVVLTKLIPRKMEGYNERPPQYKLWHVCLFRGSSLCSTVLFCERGEKAPPLPHSPLYTSNSFLEKVWIISNESPEVEDKMKVSFLCN